MNNYEILGVPYNADQHTIKRAYAALIKQYRPDSHPTEFARIRSAYEKLLEQCRYREQYEYQDDSQTEQAVIEQTSDEVVSRIIDEPAIQNQVETEYKDPYSHLVDKPSLQLPNTEPETINEELVWVQKPAIDISALIAQLEAHQQPANEQAALACFQAQLQNFSSMNLDQRMDYEEKLYICLLYDNTPSLLVFAAANSYFNWKNSASWMKAASPRRFAGLEQLSVLYAELCQRYNPYFQAQYKTKPYWLTSRYREQQAQEQREKWLQICKASQQIGDDLANYFTNKPKMHTVYISDLLFAAILSYCVFIIGLSYDELSVLEPFAIWLTPIIVIIGSLLVTLLLLAWRALQISINSGVKWAVICVTIILASTFPEAIRGPVIITLAIVITLDLIFSWMAQLETIFAKAIDSIRRLFSRHGKKRNVR